MSSSACPTVTELPPPPAGSAGWPWTEESPQLPVCMPGGTPWPRVSIVTPSYNQAQFLEETIRSVLLQGYPNLEYLVMDGGSTDGSVEILHKYEPWLAHWVSEPDRGQSHAINEGWDQSTGDVLAWINSDDLYLPGACQRAAHALVEDPDIGLVHGLCQFVDPAGRVIGQYASQPFDWARQLVSNGIAQPTVFLRRAAVEAAGHLDESLHYLMDYDLWLRVALSFNTQLLEAPQARFRRWPGAKTYTQSVGLLEEWPLVLDGFYRGSQVPPRAREVQRLACGRSHWQAAVALADAGQRSQASAHVERAVIDFAIQNLDPRWVLQKLLYGPEGLRPSEAIGRFLDLLPTADPGIRPFKREVWGHVHGIRCFEGRQAGDEAVVRRHWPQALTYHPRWLWNLGLLRIILWAYRPGRGRPVPSEP